MIPVNEDMSFTFGVEVAVQLGLLNGAGEVIMPTAWAGVAF